jgi:hypothetical protein
LDKIILYNHFHNGDVFYSRVLIEKLKHVDEICYYHNLNPFLFEDIYKLKEIRGIPFEFNQNETYFNQKQLNAWIGQQSLKYLNSVNGGCTWENYNFLTEEIMYSLGVKTTSNNPVLPKIYFENLKSYETLTTIMEEQKKLFSKIILFSNGHVESGQAHNFDFTKTIENLSSNFPNYLFLVTQKTYLNKPNIIYTSDITKKLPDLLDIGYMSTFCDVIIGRASGPYCFSQNEANLLDTQKTFICFSFHYEEGKYFDGMKSNFFWSNTGDVKEVEKLIESNI